MDGKLKDKKLHNVRLWLVDNDFRNKGLGSFLLTNTIQLAAKDGCDAVVFSACSTGAKRVAEKLRVEPQLALSPKDEDDMFNTVKDSLNCYLVLFRPL